MPTMHPSPEPLVPDKIPSQESPLSPEWTHAITTLMGHPLSSEPGKHIKKWTIYHRIHKYTMFALKWNPTQFKLDIHLQMYQKTDGSLAYLKGHIVRKLVSLMKYMSLLIRQDRPNAQKHNLIYFISSNQLFRLTAHDMKSALINEKLENHGSQTTSSKRIKMVNPKPTDTPINVPTAIQTSGNNPIDTPITVPTTIQTSVIKKGIKPVGPPQNMATSHLRDPISTTTNLDEACPLDTSCDHCIHLIHPSFHLNYKTTQVLIVMKLSFFLNQKDNWIIPTLHQQMFSLNTMTMNCSYYKRSLMHQMTIPTIMTFIPVRIKMTSSSMPTTLATSLHYPNSWHNTPVKTRSPQSIQLQYQPLPKLHVIIPSNLSVLITQWISQCNGSSSSIQVLSQG